MKYLITVDGNPKACEIGACDVQFSNGKAVVEDSRAAAWYDEHDGYTVEILKDKKEAKADAEAKAKADAEAKAKADAEKK